MDRLWLSLFFLFFFLFLTVGRILPHTEPKYSCSGRSPSAARPFAAAARRFPSPGRRRAPWSGSPSASVRRENAWPPRCSSFSWTSICHPGRKQRKIQGEGGEGGEGEGTLLDRIDEGSAGLPSGRLEQRLSWPFWSLAAVSAPPQRTCACAGWRAPPQARWTRQGLWDPAGN